MWILQGQSDYNSVRYALGLEKDQGRLLTDEVIEAFPHLPMAERDIISRLQVPVQATDVFDTLMARDPFDPSLNAVKAATAMMCCAFLCPRLELTVPMKSQLNDIGSIEIAKINWLQKRKDYMSQANWFMSLIDQTLAPHNFPTILASACGRLYANDPKYWNPNGGSSDVTGYVYPITGSGYLFGWGFTGII